MFKLNVFDSHPYNMVQRLQHIARAHVLGVDAHLVHRVGKAGAG